MKSITFEISSIDFSEKPEEKNLFDFKSNENIQPNDVVGWYEKIYGESDYDYSKLYEIDPLNYFKIIHERKSTLDINSSTVMNNNFVNNCEVVNNDQFTFNFDNMQPNTEEIEPKLSDYKNNYYNFEFSHAHANEVQQINSSQYVDNNGLESNLNTNLKAEEPKVSSSDKDSKLWTKSIIKKDAARRWGRLLDQKAFEFLNMELAKVDMDLDCFLFDNSIELISNVSQIICWKFRNSLLKRIIKRFGWHKTTFFLFKRLRKLAQNQTFSFRELKLLKRVQIKKFI